MWNRRNKNLRQKREAKGVRENEEITSRVIYRYQSLRGTRQDELERGLEHNSYVPSLD